MTYIFYFKIESTNEFRIFDDDILEFSTVNYLPKDKNCFAMLAHNDNKATDEDMIEFAGNFNIWCEELRFNKILSYKYLEASNHFSAVTKLFHGMVKYASHDTISPDEYIFYEKCPNGGLQYLSDDIIGKETDSYGYDFKSFYAGIIGGDYLIPSKQGVLHTLKTIPEKLPFGIYRVKIICADPEIKKIFSFSKHHTYTSIQLQLAIDYQFKFNISIDLILDDQPNAILYKDSDLILLSSITKKWYQKMMLLKEKYPKNMLVKHLSSSVWGHINISKTIKMSLSLGLFLVLKPFLKNDRYYF
jgi:hypothetical protein